MKIPGRIIGKIGVKTIEGFPGKDLNKFLQNLRNKLLKVLLGAL